MISTLLILNCTNLISHCLQHLTFLFFSNTHVNFSKTSTSFFGSLASDCYFLSGNVNLLRAFIFPSLPYECQVQDLPYKHQGYGFTSRTWRETSVTIVLCHRFSPSAGHLTPGYSEGTRPVVSVLQVI